LVYAGLSGVVILVNL